MEAVFLICAKTQSRHAAAKYDHPLIRFTGTHSSPLRVWTRALPKLLGWAMHQTDPQGGVCAKAASGDSAFGERLPKVSSDRKNDHGQDGKGT